MFYFYFLKSENENISRIQSDSTMSGMSTQEYMLQENALIAKQTAPKFDEKPMTLAEKKEANDKFIKQFKKTSGQKTQTVLPSAVTANNEWAVRQGWSICDAMHWRSLCEKAKMATDEIEGDSVLELLLGTIEIAARCDSHPIGLIAHARSAYGAKTWDIDTLDMMMDNLVDEDDEPEIDVHNPDFVPNTPSHQSTSTTIPETPQKEWEMNKRRRMFAASHATQPDFDDDIEDK